MGIPDLGSTSAGSFRAPVPTYPRSPGSPQSRRRPSKPWHVAQMLAGGWIGRVGDFRLLAVERLPPVVVNPPACSERPGFRRLRRRSMYDILLLCHVLARLRLRNASGRRQAGSQGRSPCPAQALRDFLMDIFAGPITGDRRLPRNRRRTPWPASAAQGFRDTVLKSYRRWPTLGRRHPHASHRA